jgi:hypothetical protein
MYFKTRLQLKKGISGSLWTTENYKWERQKHTIAFDDMYVVPITRDKFLEAFTKFRNNTAPGVKCINMGLTTYVPQSFPNKFTDFIEHDKSTVIYKKNGRWFVQPPIVANIEEQTCLALHIRKSRNSSSATNLITKCLFSFDVSVTSSLHQDAN